MTTEKSDFGKAVAGVYRDLKGQIERRPTEVSSDSVNAPIIDRSVKEQVVSDLDRKIGEYEGR